MSDTKSGHGGFASVGRFVGSYMFEIIWDEWGFVPLWCWCFDGCWDCRMQILHEESKGVGDWMLVQISRVETLRPRFRKHHERRRQASHSTPLCEEKEMTFTWDYSGGDRVGFVYYYPLLPRRIRDGGCVDPGQTFNMLCCSCIICSWGVTGPSRFRFISSGIRVTRTSN